MRISPRESLHLLIPLFIAANPLHSRPPCLVFVVLLGIAAAAVGQTFCFSAALTRLEICTVFFSWVSPLFYAARVTASKPFPPERKAH